MKMYLVKRSNEYLSKNGFWGMNIYDPYFFHTAKEAQEEIDKLNAYESEGCEIVKTDIKIH